MPDMWGCVFSTRTEPCVAHLVCAIPIVPLRSKLPTSAIKLAPSRLPIAKNFIVRLQSLEPAES